MDFKELGNVLIDKGLPLLGSVLGGRVGEGIGSTLANVLGCDVEDLPAQLEDGSKILELKQYEMNHKQELEALALEETKAFLLDRQSARSREVEIAKATGSRDINLYVLAWVVVLGFFTLLGILIFRVIPAENSNILNLVIGSLLGSFTTVIGYFFGSSKGSLEKNTIISKSSRIV